MVGDWIESSRAKAAEGDARGAFDDAMVAVRLAPDDWVSHAQVALTAESVRAYKTALAAAERWSVLAPGMWQAHAALGRINLELNRNVAAHLAFLAARKLNPSDLEVDVRLTLLDVYLRPHRQRRVAMERVEQFVSDGALPARVLSVIADECVTRYLFPLAASGSWLTLIYFLIVTSYEDRGLMDASTVTIPLLASATVASVLLAWYGALWRRTTPRTRHLLPGLLRREPNEALGLAGQSVALALLLCIPFVWTAGASAPTSALAALAWGLSALTEILTSGFGLGPAPRLRDVAKLLLQPPYVIVGALSILCMVVIARELGPPVRRLLRGR